MWKLYFNTPDLWRDMLDACRHATKSIDLEQFIFVNDEIGKQFIDVCALKASQGVRVRFLLDDAGSWNIFGAFLASDLSKLGIQVRFFNTIIPNSFNNHRWWFFRNHRRSLVVDGTTAFTGSMSIWKNTEHWHDASVRFFADPRQLVNGLPQKSIVTEIVQTFEVMWDRANNIRRNWGTGKTISTDGFAYVVNAPLPRKRFLYHQLLDAIRSAHTYIYIVTPYFVPDHRLVRVIRLAARRGVDIRLILPEASDHPVVDIGSHSFFTSLMKSGVSIYRLPRSTPNDQFLHSKVIVIDGEWGSIGTMNLDHVSLLYNFESAAVTHNKEFIAGLHEYCIKEMRASVRVERDVWERRGMTQKWLEFVTRFIRPFL